MSLQYRADIQVLRGLAVIVVVIFHFSPDLMPSGFLGVDIFFVISGFLMCSLYKPDSKEKLVSAFYQRRFSRIIPAYFTTITLCLIFGSYIFIPYEFSVLLEQALAALIGIPNIILWTGESYFDEFAFRPLLHLWSLGVEIQFYIIVPLIYLLISRSKLLFLFLTIGSFASCIFVALISSKTAFFMLPFRIWEFLIGFAVAYYFSDSGNIKTDKFSYYGLLSITILFFLSVYPLKIGPHPGLSALLVCILTGTILLAGLPVKFLSSRSGKFLEGLGKYSYSLYLVHFPILIFMYYEPFGGETINASLDSRFFLTAISIITATLCLYHLVENRNWKRLLETKRSIPIALLLVGFSMLPASYAINDKSYTGIEKDISFAPLDRSFWRCGKYEKLLRVIDSNHLVCSLSNLNGKNFSENILIIGDSHADAIKQTVASVADENNANVYFMIDSCNLGVDDCRIENITKITRSKKISKILLHDFYKNIQLTNISNLLKELDNRDIIVYYLDPIPVYPSSTPQYLLKNHNYNHVDTEFQKNREDFEFKYKHIHEALNKLDLVRIPTLETLCNPECQIVIGTNPIYADSNHLTLTGAKKLEPAIDSVMFPK